MICLSIVQKAHAGGGLVAEGEMIEVIDLPFAEAKEMVTCQASEDRIENYDATFLFLIYWFLYNKESTVIRNGFQHYCRLLEGSNLRFLEDFNLLKIVKRKK